MCIQFKGMAWCFPGCATEIRGDPAMKYVAANAELRRRNKLDPTAQFPPHDVFNDIKSGFRVIQARNMGKFLTAVFNETMPGFNGNFFKRFKTVGNKTRIENGNPFGAAAGEFLDGFIRIGLQPFLGAKSRLKSRH